MGPAFDFVAADASGNLLHKQSVLLIEPALWASGRLEWPAFERLGLFLEAGLTLRAQQDHFQLGPASTAQEVSSSPRVSAEVGAGVTVRLGAAR
jgi:hypothetical protein